MVLRIGLLAALVAAFSLVHVTQAADDTADGSAAADSGASKADWAPSSRPSNRLVPFPEDEEAAQPIERARAESNPLRSSSSFQPKFKAPPVRQAQFTEPAEEKAGGGPELEPALDSAAPAAAAPKGAAWPGKESIETAFKKAQGSKSDSDCTAVIELCRAGLKTGLSRTYDEYARRLMGWAYNRRGELRAEEGKEAEALADFEAAVENGGSWKAIHNRGVSYAAQGRLKEALVDFDRTIEINPQYPNAFFNRGELKYEKADYVGAIRDYTAALKMGQPDAATYNSRGHAFYRLQKYGDALRDYGEAVKLDPENAAALINRGDTYSDMGQYGEAARDYRAAVRMAPKLGRAYQSAAWLMATCPDDHYRNDKLAIDAAKKAIDLDGDDYRNLSTLAAAQASAGQYEEAQATQEKAIARASRHDRQTAERMMTLYKREIAYRDRPRNGGADPEEGEVRQASGTAPLKKSTGDGPARPNTRGRY